MPLIDCFKIFQLGKTIIRSQPESLAEAGGQVAED